VKLILTLRPDEGSSEVRRLLANLERERLAHDLVVGCGALLGAEVEPHFVDARRRPVAGPSPVADFLALGDLVAELLELRHK
jgi:hypothetical protein